MMMIAQGDSSHLVRNRLSMAFTAPSPSKTAPKQSEAIRIHMNMQVMPSVFCSTSFQSRTLRRPRHQATSAEQIAPTAELSTRLAMPLRNSHIISAKRKSSPFEVPSMRSKLFT